MRHTEGGRPRWRSFVFALAAVFTVSGTFTTEAWAQRGRERQVAEQRKAGPVTPGLDRVRGAKEAPGAVQAAGLTCTITDAALLGTITEGANKLNAYEVACREGLGYVVQQTVGGGTTRAFDCIVIEASAKAAEAAGKTATRCKLPGNAQPATGLQPLVVSTGRACTVNNARYAGSRANGAAIYEISCTEGGGFMLERPTGAGAQPTLINCISVLGTPTACQLTTSQQVIASLVPIVAQAQRQCTIRDARVAGTNPQTKNDIVEIGCADDRPGFLLELNNTGGFVRAIDCDRVSGLNCTFTNVATLQAANQNSLLERVRAAGLGDCTPSNVRVIGNEVATSRQVVEVACSNRAHGAIAVLGSTPGARSDVYDCLFARRWQTECQLTQPAAVYPRVSSALRLQGGKNPNCSITNARWMGATPQGESWFDITCADGRSFLMDYRGNGQVARVLTCREGSAVGGGCRAGIRASIPKD